MFPKNASKKAVSKLKLASAGFKICEASDGRYGGPFKVRADKEYATWVCSRSNICFIVQGGSRIQEVVRLGFCSKDKSGPHDLCSLLRRTFNWLVVSICQVTIRFNLSSIVTTFPLPQTMLRFTHLRHYSPCSFRSYHVTTSLRMVRLWGIPQLSTYIYLL